MNNELGWKEIFLAVLLSTGIISLISFGLLIKLWGYHFWGFVDFLAGGLAVYYLCIKYFEGETKKVNKCKICKKPLKEKDKLGVCTSCGNMTIREYFKMMLNKK